MYRSTQSVSRASKDWDLGKRIRNGITRMMIRLENPGDYQPGRLSAILKETGKLFKMEEILMFETGYPDFLPQREAHQCFLCEVRRSLNQDDFFGAEKFAAAWMDRHEILWDGPFRKFLERRARFKHDGICDCPLPDHVLLPGKVIF